ncbi:hypothetical protein A2232_08180 [candidate division WOR-1 bacterium RIFOXYA2_FULL_46_56]|uniref:Organic solvent tolerance-like N-terminal domain-containing protein n=1 Tax=candidate division WOR-1 bacterium RIFOXYC2_FULL_46_14 TaxID=1802587 RepID=A0A1F4U3Z1_UNCSA|nr:MAG: hypothetical protein A2292_03270 [candidate division WOR-1 bacterium RIFOXYB2_FULL_46_45]OGC32189.1 MAG: hypothetical protein A2232_08180 [candidate division WOR-1 bacterium RIFOXYA2_FULL_46_56]OGC39589.1 MAG: hypothetical protein A2438_08545 [candidate division WOR-1 bacterium RIFOXYC2_FULL_46_14]
MEQTPWKPILVGTIASLILLFSVYFFALPKQELGRPSEKILEFSGSTIVGHDKGKKVWEFSSKGGWVGKEQNITNLEEVVKGSFYKDNKLQIKNFTAAKVSAFRDSKIIEAKSANALIAIGKERKFVRIKADSLSYNPDRSESILSGNVKVSDKSETLFCQNLHIDHKEGISTARDNLRAVIYGKQISTLKADSLVMDADEKEEVILNGSVEAVQGKKQAVADSAVYNKNGKDIRLKGKVKAVISKAGALIKEETAQKLRDNETKEILKEKTLQTSDSLILSTLNGDYRAEGNVIVEQKNRIAKSDTAEYSDKDEIITLTGNVYIKQKERWVKCRKVLVSVKDQTFEAFGSVEAEFKL